VKFSERREEVVEPFREINFSKILLQPTKTPAQTTRAKNREAKCLMTAEATIFVLERMAEEKEEFESRRIAPAVEEEIASRRFALLTTIIGDVFLLLLSSLVLFGLIDEEGDAVVLLLLLFSVEISTMLL
jgi:hypothetical protein